MPHWTDRPRSLVAADDKLLHTVFSATAASAFAPPASLPAPAASRAVGW